MWSMRFLFLLSLTFSLGSFLSEEQIEDEESQEIEEKGVDEDEGRK